MATTTWKHGGLGPGPYTTNSADPVSVVYWTLQPLIPPETICHSDLF
jgi:hypothetical protein